MKSKIFRMSLLLLFVLALLIACTTSDFPGYKKDPNGLNYKVYNVNKHGTMPVVGDFLTLALTYRNSEDSILFNSKDMEGGFRIPAQESGYIGDFFYAISTMHLYDSISFVISADSFFLKTVGTPELPAFVSPGDFLFFEVKLENIQPKSEFEKEQKALLEKANELREKKRQQEMEELDEYITNNNIGLKPTESGLFFIPINKGKGRSPEDGNTVKVHYTGVFLDGEKFDSSYERNDPIEFEVGAKNIIPGWNEGIKLMHEGGKAVLIVPSKLAYGEQGRDDIPPFTTLVFEIELLEVK